MGAGIVAGLCCCTKGNPPIPDEKAYYECKPMVCEQGFNNCFSGPVSLWYVVFTPEEIEFMVGDLGIDPESFEWVWAGQMWQCVRLLGTESEKPLEPYSDVRIVNVFPAFNTIPDNFPEDGAEILVMPDHRVSANNTGEVAKPTAENSLTLQRTSGDNTYITRYHMVNSFIHEMHNQYSNYRWAGVASIGNATPDLVSTKMGNPDQSISVTQYQVTYNEIGFPGLTPAGTSDEPYPVFTPKYEKFNISAIPGSVGLRYAIIAETLAPFPPLPIGGYEPGEDVWEPYAYSDFNVVFVAGERVRGIPHTDGVRNFMEGDNNECERFGPATYIPVEARSEEGGNTTFWPPESAPVQADPTEEPNLTVRFTIRQLEVDSCDLLSTKTLKTEGESPACPTGNYFVYSLGDSGSAPKKGVQYFPVRNFGEATFPAQLGTNQVRVNLISVG